jgi:N-acetylneuraminic acid mutarotase
MNIRFSTPLLNNNGPNKGSLLILILTFCIALAGLVASAQSEVTDWQGTWMEKSPMPGGPRSDFPAVVVNDKVYVFGGAAPVGMMVPGIYGMRQTEEYDPATDRWRERAPMPRGLHHIEGVALDGKIYTVGGFTARAHASPDDAVFEYNPATDSWRTLPPLKSKRGAVAIAAADGKIHAIGGREGDIRLTTDHDVYDPTTGKWSEAAPLSRARDHLVARTVDGRIHVIGGRFSIGDEDMTNMHEIYDFKTNSWSAGPPLPTARGGVTGAFYDGMIFVMGGEDGKRTYDENEAYDVKANRWVRLKPLPQPMHAFAAAAVGRNLYIIGGAKRTGSHDVVGGTLAFSLP